MVTINGTTGVSKVAETAGMATDTELAAAKAIMLAIATPVSQAEFNMNAKKNAVNDAMTITAVNAVVW